MDKKQIKENSLDLRTPGEGSRADLEEAVRILRSLPAGPERDVTIANVLAIARGARRRAQEWQE